MEEKIKLCNLEIDDLKRRLEKSKQICSVSKLLLLIVLIGFMLSLCLNTKLQRYNRVLSTRLDSVIYKSEQVMLISSKNAIILDKHIKFKGLSNKEQKKMLFNEKLKRRKNEKMLRKNKVLNNKTKIIQK